MEASNVASSFLCFLPELQCTPTNIMYSNGITESNGIQHFSAKPSSLVKKNGLNGKFDSPNRSSNASAEVGSGIGDGFVENRVPSAGSFCRREALRIGSSASSMEESRGEHEQPDLATRTVLQSFNQGELRSLQVAECNGRYDLSRRLSEEEDNLAFEITEFFNSFQDGKEHIFVKLREKLNSVSPDSILASRGNQLGAISNPKSADGQSKFGELGMPGDEENTAVEMCPRSSSAGQSGKWSGLLEVDSFSATFSGPLTFSGPISFSGHSAHTPYSGSVSHRSDSSTASTHSFAFPILPCEWNSSPVKMPQPDRRFTEKGWKQRLRSFFCCADSLN